MLRPANDPPQLGTLILLTAISVLSLNMFLPSLANIAAEFEASYAVTSLSVSGFLAVNGVLQLALGPLSDRFGRRPVILWTMAVFTVASVVAALASSIWVFLAARTLQAGIIAGSVVGAAVVTDVYKRDEAARQMSLIAMAMAIAPMIGPMIGGGLDTLFGWRSNFWLFTVFGFAMCWLVWVDLGETRPETSGGESVFEGLPELIRSRRFWAMSIVIASGVGAFFMFISAAPLVGGEVYGLSTTLIGVGIGVITTGFFFGTYLSGRFAARIGLVKFIVIGRAAAVLGVAIALGLLLAGVTHPLAFFGGAVMTGFGNGLSIPNARAVALALRPHLAGSASGLSGALTTLAGAGLTALPGLVLTPENGAWLATAMMLGLATLCLAAALYALQVERRETLSEER